MDDLMIKVRLTMLELILIDTPEKKERYLEAFKRFQGGVKDTVISADQKEHLEVLLEQHLQSIDALNVPQS